ncbi:hypothetical protein [Paraurantiacibacter namhicola]|uniref:Uncharacterized protein n=1 Tax=Paraurantiacibacter namhicola TaxID=645517 RepID=A0A1C7D5B4_9SPHN|nr:hypothetical protein [Paraurantiacibacter namhicola]ANU06648.1 hypothetical protein A6F65_00321 [Paraurantiacibacter namhicola]
MAEPTMARPVFSTEDFRLLRAAVVEYIRAHDGEEGVEKYVNLHHRLGRFGERPPRHTPATAKSDAA